MPMQPSPSAETSRPELPSERFCNMSISIWAGWMVSNVETESKVQPGTPSTMNTRYSAPFNRC